MALRPRPGWPDAPLQPTTALLLLLVPCRTCAVSSLHDAAKLLSKHSKPMQRLDRAVHATIKGLQPSPASSRHLLHKLQAAANNARGAASM